MHPITGSHDPLILCTQVVTDKKKCICVYKVMRMCTRLHSLPAESREVVPLCSWDLVAAGGEGGGGPSFQVNWRGD